MANQKSTHLRVSRQHENLVSHVALQLLPSFIAGISPDPVDYQYAVNRSFELAEIFVKTANQRLASIKPRS